MFTKRRLRLLSALLIILVAGFILVINNLRPVSERKRSGKERLDTKMELQKISSKINTLTDSIKEFPDRYILLYNRAKLYKSINKYTESMEGFKKFIEQTHNVNMKMKAEKELESIRKIKEYMEKQ